ncbi:hypothetical protein B9Z55_014086 [Caenorhabditis nigoni]|uniref:Uncharacterized protein n=1 Tax=Caenorhabditis nigoni TaxID=1611254 RepID=A0A2G5U4I8_9PELO|nr:hypothetical protein B9Z55_014086 [Caenorhabditis nigoni]
MQCLLLLLFLPDVVNSVKCYCTDDHCVPYGSCDGTVCLVGILRDSNQVIRTCGTNTLGCHKNEDDKWTDLCACDQPFCNTFAFLRTHTRFDLDKVLIARVFRMANICLALTQIQKKTTLYLYPGKNVFRCIVIFFVLVFFFFWICITFFLISFRFQSSRGFNVTC